MICVQIGDRIKQLRDREGISQSALASALDSTRAAVNAWEMGISNPSMQSLIELSRYFRVSVDSLLGLEDTDRITLAGLSPEEKALVLKMIRHFEREHKAD